MNYKGVIIEESLENKEVLKLVKIVSTRVELVTEEYKTPWLKQWTLQTVEIPEKAIDQITEKISQALDQKHWYADFKNESTHFIVFRGKVFKVDRSKPEQYDSVSTYGVSLGIPDYQLDFSPAMQDWKR